MNSLGIDASLPFGVMETFVRTRTQAETTDVLFWKRLERTALAATNVIDPTQRFMRSGNRTPTSRFAAKWPLVVSDVLTKLDEFESGTLNGSAVFTASKTFVGSPDILPSDSFGTTFPMVRHAEENWTGLMFGLDFPAFIGSRSTDHCGSTGS